MSKPSWIGSLFGFIALFAASSTLAANVNLTESPVNWQLQDYIEYTLNGQVLQTGGPTGIVVWNTGATTYCGAQGHLGFPSNVSTDEVNRFWAAVMTARTTGKNMSIWYDSSECLITSFYVP